MTAAGTGMGRQVRSTLLVRDDPMSPDGGKARSTSGSGTESSNSGSSSTSTSVSSSSGDTEEDEPSKLAKTKSALRNVKSEEVAARAKKHPHFYVETSGRPPRVLPTKATRQEKHKCSDAHQRSRQILEEFLQEYNNSVGQLVHHYKECCKKKDHLAEGVYALRVI